MPEPDPREQLRDGIMALSSIGDLLLEASGPIPTTLHLTDTQNLHTLLSLVRGRLEDAQKGFAGWRPY